MNTMNYQKLSLFVCLLVWLSVVVNINKAKEWSTQLTRDDHQRTFTVLSTSPLLYAVRTNSRQYANRLYSVHPSHLRHCITYYLPFVKCVSRCNSPWHFTSCCIPPPFLFVCVCFQISSGVRCQFLSTWKGDHIHFFEEEEIITGLEF